MKQKVAAPVLTTPAWTNAALENQLSKQFWVRVWLVLEGACPYAHASSLAANQPLSPARARFQLLPPAQPSPAKAFVSDAPW